MNQLIESNYLKESVQRKESYFNVRLFSFLHRLIPSPHKTPTYRQEPQGPIPCRLYMLP